MTGRPQAAPLLEGALNFRDFGGLPTADGRRVKRGVLFRSEQLNALTDGDLEQLGALGIQLVCDLRSPAERDRGPSRWPAHATPELLKLETLDAAEVHPLRIGQVLDDSTGEAGREFMLDGYRAMPGVIGTGMRRLVDRIVDDRELPLLVHCLAGKDRTGFVAAVLLLAVDVPRTAVLDEYLLSGAAFDLDRMTAALPTWTGRPASPPLPPEVVRPFVAQAEYLEAALDAIDAEHGSFERYLEACAGLTAQRRRALQDLLVE